jgi:hypothetical protein
MMDEGDSSGAEAIPESIKRTKAGNKSSGSLIRLSIDLDLPKN